MHTQRKSPLKKAVSAQPGYHAAQSSSPARTFARILGLVLFCGFGLTAHAQTFEGNHNRFETPLGRASSAEIETMATNTRDANNNRVIIQRQGREFSATSIGNLINVQLEGSNNTVMINAQQINKGSQRVEVGNFSSQ